MEHKSREEHKSDNERNQDLRKPSQKADLEYAKDLGPKGRDTNAKDPKSLSSWENDPYLL